MINKPRIIVILGPTATGKSDLAVYVAKQVDGEIISADSRQVYTGLDIGTGKITKKEMRGVPHHLLDVASPKKVFSVSDWQSQAEKTIIDIMSRGKTPIICGGTGFYIQSIVDNIVLPEVPPNPKLRKKLEEKTTEELLKILTALDSHRAEGIDQKNPVRMIRAIEIATELGSVPKINKNKSPYEFIQIGLTANEIELKKRIHTRLLKRLKKGMIDEAKKLHASGLSYKRMHQLGLEYRYLADFLQDNISKDELITKLDQEIYQYTRRQMAWFKRDKRIKWFDVEKVRQKEILKLVSQ